MPHKHDASAQPADHHCCCLQDIKICFTDHGHHVHGDFSFRLPAGNLHALADVPTNVVVTKGKTGSASGVLKLPHSMRKWLYGMLGMCCPSISVE